ncbi:MAG TPA: hypothetical protein VNT75_17990 [Symbiobacteriaceae bacterium]|nr:hypothetical protein [Symbiobacteriaceae bacterium]
MPKSEGMPEKPMIPMNATPVNVPTEPTQMAHMLDSVLMLQYPAKVTVSALATTDITGASEKNHLGTPRPSEVMVGVDATNTYLYVVPVRPQTPGATPVKYDGGRCSFNLYHTFRKLDRLVPKGTREYYTVKPTPGEVTIGDVKGWGIYLDLTDFVKEPVSRLSDEEKARRAEKRRRTIAAKKAAKEAKRDIAPGTETPEE